MSEISDYWKPQLLKTERDRDEARRKLGDIAIAIRDYHYALDCREHGGVAADKALNRIQELMGMPWVTGKEKELRTSKFAKSLDVPLRGHCGQ